MRKKSTTIILKLLHFSRQLNQHPAAVCSIFKAQGNRMRKTETLRGVLAVIVDLKEHRYLSISLWVILTEKNIFKFFMFFSRCISSHFAVKLFQLLDFCCFIFLSLIYLFDLPLTISLLSYNKDEFYFTLFYSIKMKPP